MLWISLITSVTFFWASPARAAEDCEMRLSNHGLSRLTSDVVFYHRELMKAYSPFKTVNSFILWTDPHGQSAKMTSYFAQINPNQVTLPILAEDSRARLQSKAVTKGGQQIEAHDEFSLSRRMGLVQRIDLIFDRPARSLYDPDHELTLFNVLLATNMGTRADNLRLVLNVQEDEFVRLIRRVMDTPKNEDRDRILLNLPAVQFFMRELSFPFVGYEVLPNQVILNFLIHSDEEILQSLMAPSRDAN